MTFLSPVPMPDAIESEVWRAYVAERTRTFFDAHARDDAFDAVCFMLVPKPRSLPILAVEDEYDNLDSLTRRMLHTVDEFDRGVHFTENSCGQIVIAWPFSIVDDDHRSTVLDLLRDVGRDLKAVATALVSECWLRTDLTAPRGTGSDVLMACCEQVGRDVTVEVAEIEGAMPARSLGPWMALDGVARGGAILGLFDDEPETTIPPGFTPKINVATVGEA